MTPADPSHAHDDSDNDSDADDADSSTSPTPLPPPADDTALEPWVDWVRRCTHEAERHLSRLGIQDWNTIQQQRKALSAGKVLSETHKWSHHALRWDPQTTHPDAHRRQGRPKTRWEDDIKQRIQ